MLGRNASIVVDNYVTAGRSRAKAITLRLVSGSARFLTGASDKSFGPNPIELRKAPLGYGARRLT